MNIKKTRKKGLTDRYKIAQHCLSDISICFKEANIIQRGPHNYKIQIRSQKKQLFGNHSLDLKTI